MKRMNKINAKYFVPVITILFVMSNFLLGQNIIYDAQNDHYSLSNPYMISGIKKDSLCHLINNAIKNNDRSSIKRIIRADNKNILALLKISSEIETKTPKGKFANHDQYSFKEIIDLVIEQNNLNYWGFVSYFQFLNDLNKECVNKIIISYDDEYDSWFPLYLNEFQEFLLLFRHDIKHFFPTEKLNYNDIWKDFVFFMDLRFNDASILEIKKLNYESNSIKQIKDEPNPNLINIKNSKIKITASSVLSKKYCTSNLLDYDLNNVWAEGSDGDGSGETVNINLNEKEYVKNLILFPGHSKSEKLFTANNRLKDIEINVNGERSKINIKDVFAPVSIPIEKTTLEIKIKILSVYKGNKYNDLCISEIMLTRK